MAWGKDFEIYVLNKDEEQKYRSSDAIVHFFVKGEIWDPDKIQDFSKRLRRFVDELDLIISNNGSKNICIRSNQ